MHRSSIGTPSNQRFSPLHIAAQDGNLEALHCLVEELGADVNGVNGEGFSALFAAADARNLEVMQCLVKECGANVNQADRKGGTPLYLAVERGLLGSVRCLVELGADVNTNVPYNYAIPPKAWRGPTGNTLRARNGR
jgi:ankyrin repeat protein